MPAFYKIDKGRRLVLSTSSGVFNLEEALKHQRKLQHDPGFDPSYSQLLDFRQVTNIELTPADVHRLAEANLFAPQSRRAVLVKGNLAFGLARMFEMLRDSMGERGIRVFTSLDEALHWIFGKDTPK